MTIPILYADGNYDRRKKATLDELGMVIERVDSRSKKPRDVVRVGGASWSDLRVLDKETLGRLNIVLEDCSIRLLRHIALPSVMNDETIMAHRKLTSAVRIAAEKELQRLL